MALNIKDPETDRLARELAKRTGESLTEAINRALRERLDRHKAKQRPSGGLADRIMEIGRQAAALPVIKPIDEVMDEMYDEDGAPR